MSNPTNPLGRGFVASEARVALGKRAQHGASNILSTAIQQYSLTPTVSRKHKNYKIDSTDDIMEAQKNPVEKKSSPKEPFSSDGIRLYNNWPNRGRQNSKELSCGFGSEVDAAGLK